MSAFAAQLVDRVIPRVPVRQWVLTVPHGLRAKMMFDPALTSAVLRELIRAVSSWLRQRARREGVVGAVKTGAVTVIQRFNSALGANPHFHTLFLDGVYTFPVGRAPVTDSGIWGGPRPSAPATAARGNWSAFRSATYLFSPWKRGFWGDLGTGASGRNRPVSANNV